jgi:hypothetical protein
MQPKMASAKSPYFEDVPRLKAITAQAVNAKGADE